MNNFAVETWDNEQKLCTFYTVKNEFDTQSETDKFFSKYYNDDKYKRHVQELLSLLIDSIGNDHGAIDAFFNRHENNVSGLPPKLSRQLYELQFRNFPLRLYALKLSETIVVLFNGGVKDARTNQESSLNIRWIEACQFAIRIESAIRDGEIIMDTTNKQLLSFNGKDEILI
jgi:hypothetical protein